MDSVILHELCCREVEVTSSKVNGIVLNFQGEALIDDHSEINSWIRGTEGPRAIAAQNGLISFDELDDNSRPRLLEHTPEYFTLSQLPYDYDPNATCQKWSNFLREVMDDDEGRILLLQQWAGYLLVPNLREQKFMIFLGDGANGKGVFSEVLERMVGVDNCSHVSLARFHDRFSLGYTLGKILHSTSESSKDLEKYAEEILKAYTAGDRMTFDQKFQTPIDAVPTAKLMISTNELPQFKDSTQGTWRRILLVPFERTIPENEQNKNLADELSQELPGIFNWAYEGMIHLEEKGFIKPKICEEAQERYQNPILDYLQNEYEYERGNNNLLAVHIMYFAYKQWCKDNKYDPIKDAEFGKAVRGVFPEVEKTRRGPKESRVAYYSGLVKKNGEVKEVTTQAVP